MKRILLEIAILYVMAYGVWLIMKNRYDETYKYKTKGMAQLLAKRCPAVYGFVTRHFLFKMNYEPARKGELKHKTNDKRRQN